MTIRDFQLQFSNSLLSSYDEAEAHSVSRVVVMNITGWDAARLHLHRDNLITTDQMMKGNEILSELRKGRPLQYVLQEAWFDGFRLFVDERVLIPRPETEELVNWIRSDYKGVPFPLSIADLCTGSGCIALALKRSFPLAGVQGLDLSTDALTVALKNAIDLDLQVEFLKADVLSEEFTPELDCELLISNPPYVRYAEKSEMHDRVKAHEPHLALFVPDNDPLLFYKRLMVVFSKLTNPSRRLYIEINEAFSTELLELAESFSLDAEVRTDLFGKYRFIRCLPRS